jgi:hypothetical protein
MPCQRLPLCPDASEFFLPLPCHCLHMRRSTDAFQSEETLSDFRPYPDHPFYLADLWFYSLHSGRWSLMEPLSATAPPARMDHSMVKARHLSTCTLKYDYMYGGLPQT